MSYNSFPILTSAVSTCANFGATHRLDGAEFGEVRLRVSQERAVSISMMGEALSLLAPFRTGQQDPNLGCPNMIWEVLIGCGGACDNLRDKRINKDT